MGMLGGWEILVKAHWGITHWEENATPPPAKEGRARARRLRRSGGLLRVGPRGTDWSSHMLEIGLSSLARTGTAIETRGPTDADNVRVTGWYRNVTNGSPRSVLGHASFFDPIPRHSLANHMPFRAPGVAFSLPMRKYPVKAHSTSGLGDSVRRGRRIELVSTNAML